MFFFSIRVLLFNLMNYTFVVFQTNVNQLQVNLIQIYPNFIEFCLTQNSDFHNHTYIILIYEISLFKFAEFPIFIFIFFVIDITKTSSFR